MEISQIKTFTIVAQTLNFTRAAEVLGLTQPAVSHQIKSLENELGVNLFVRGNRKITLTSDGKLVLDYAQKMLEEVRALRENIADTGQSEVGPIRLTAATRGIGNPFILLRKFWHEVNSEVELSFHAEMYTESILNSVRTGKSDVGFITSVEMCEGVLLIPWCEFDLVFAAGPEHPLVKLESVNAELLQNELWLLFENGSWLRRETDKVLNRYDIRPSRVSESNDGHVISSLVKDGTGISLMPKWGIVEELLSGEIKELSVGEFFTKIPIILVVSESSRPRIVNEFIKFILETDIELMVRRIEFMAQATNRSVGK